MAKIFEKVIHNWLLNYIEKYDLINENQFGFRRNKSTSDAVQSLTELIYEKLDKSERVMAIFLDLSKAFDTVNHNKLLQKLQNIGIRGLPLHLIKSYLENRVQVVKLNDTYSDELTVKIGVPQGTILWPLLFLVYINDLLKKKIKGKIISYADDTSLVLYESSWRELENAANLAVNDINKWLRNNGLTINVEKTNYILFCNHNNTKPIKFKVIIHDDDQCLDCDCKSITSINSTKYLGIIIDSNMKWREHMELLKKN